MSDKSVTILCVGDIIIDREEPHTIFDHVLDTLGSGDLFFATCDQAYSDKGYPLRPGTNSDPRNIPALTRAGINVVSLANNHILDYGKEAMLDTVERLEKAGIRYVGVGRNLAEARRPVILERKGVKVGFLAYSSVHPKGFEATGDRPGLTPIRIWTIYEQIDEQPATPPRIVSIPHKEDLLAMVEDVKALRPRVDVLILSFHWGLHMLPQVIPMYCFDVGHAAIDAGADAIIGSHTHILKGIEMYKGRPIFYSLGNFAAEIGVAQQKGLGIEGVKTLLERYGVVPDPECPTYPLPREARATMIAKLTIDNKRVTKVSYIPCFVNKDAEPEVVKGGSPLGEEVFNYVKKISESQGLPVGFRWEGDEVLVLPGK